MKALIIRESTRDELLPVRGAVTLLGPDVGDDKGVDMEDPQDELPNRPEVTETRAEPVSRAAKVMLTKTKMGKNWNTNPEPPAFLVCPISHELFKEPMNSRYGQVYEKECILEWIEKKRTDPITRKPLEVKDLTPALTIKNEADDWRRQERRRQMSNVAVYRGK